YIERLARAGNRVITIQAERRTRQDLLHAESATLDAMRTGIESIYQAVFFDGKWVGYADLLQKVPTPSNLGDWSYEVVDTKLARTPKAHFILQLASYTEQLARVQGVKPAKMHLVLGTREQVSFRVADFEAYYRYIKRRFEERCADLRVSQTLPYLIDFCSLCEWNLHCWRHLEKLDHLVRVAGIRRDHVRRLEAHGITTMTRLGDTPSAHVEKIRDEAYETLHHQARLQAEQIRTKQHRYELLEPETDRGFELLPRPSPGDVFLDLEADPYAGEGITYLFGIATPDRQYRAWWAEDALQQKRAFEEVIDFISARRREHPDLHIYHYTAAEPSALKRMSGEFGSREREIDDFLRSHVFTDLFTIVKQAMRISQPSYSLKKLEAFYFHREEEGVFERGGPILAYEEWLDTRDPAVRTSIENYNREDCVSTVELRDWLLTLRPPSTPWFDRAPDEQSQDAIDAAMQTDALAQALLASVPPDLIDATEDEKARWLLAHLLYYHQREARPQWWWYFARKEMSAEELVEDGESIGRLELAKDIPPRKEKRSKIYTFRFPAQQHKIDHRAVDPATEKTLEVIRVDDANGIVEIKLGPKSAMPQALIPPKPINDNILRDAVRRVAESGEPYKAATDILHRRPIEGSSYVFVQGPPGAGKTWWARDRIVELLAQGYRVGVASNSHKAIHNLLDEVEKIATRPFRGLKKWSSDDAEKKYESTHITSSDKIDDFLDPEVNLVAGTAWLFANEKLDQTLDYVFIDEAGQVSLANAIAISTAARFVYLMGDPLQLAQVSQAPHPGTSGASVLEHLLGSDATIASDRGLFLAHTYRMHPDVCRFVSEVVYEGRLKS
ncbi:MAG: TM0106 family RecB-like putative nuclease, partial [Thermoanaerobaculia bacterium]